MDETKTLTPQQQNFLSELLQTAEAELALRNKKRELIARWNLNEFAVIFKSDAIKSNQTFEHLDIDKVVSGITAFEAVLAALGDDVSGQATNLIKLRG